MVSFRACANGTAPLVLGREGRTVEFDSPKVINDVWLTVACQVLNFKPKILASLVEQTTA